MPEIIYSIFQRLVNHLSIETKRYLFANFDISNRLTGIVGPRGVGKTTLMLQYIKERYPDGDEAFYFSADNIVFSKT